MQRVALVGGSGLIGGYLQSYLTLHYDVKVYSRKNGFDVGQPEKFISTIREYDPHFIVYLVNSFTINETEKLSKESQQVARMGPLRFIEGCSELCSKFIFFSSDHVFDGSSGNYDERVLPNPMSAFGNIKRDLETAIIQLSKKYIIIRTSAVYGVPNARKNSLENWALTMLTKGIDIEGYDNVIFSPTYIKDIAIGLIRLISLDYEGVIHLSGIEACSRYNFLIKLRNNLLEINPNIGQVKKGQSPVHRSQIFNTSLNSSNFWELMSDEPTNMDYGLKRSIHEFGVS